jgi:hypothetical protein
VQGKTGEAEAERLQQQVAEEMQATESSVDDDGALLREWTGGPALGDWQALAGDRRSK